MVFVIHLHEIDLTDDKRIHTLAKCYQLKPGVSHIKLNNWCDN